MRTGRRQRVWRGILRAAAVLAVVFGIPLVVMVRNRTGEVERVIRRFEAAPSQEHADQLSHFIRNEGDLTKEQVNHIVRLLLKPDIITRPAYPAGSFPEAILKYPFAWRLTRGQIHSTHVLDGRQTSHSGWHIIYKPPDRVGGYIRLTGLGVHRMEVCYAGHVIGGSRTTWTWDPLHSSMPFPRSLLPFRTSASETWHQFSFSVPVEFTMVEEDRAPKVEWISNTDLDRSMPRAFTSALHGGCDRYATKAGDRWFKNILLIQCRALPTAVAFEPVLRLADGREIPRCNLQSRRYRVAAGGSRDFWISAREFLIETPGDYRGAIVLRPDVNCACEDPDLNAIWSGTLEFPIQFTVALERQQVSK